MLPHSCHSLLWFALPLVFADVEFTSPAAGSNVPCGTIEVAWKDSGRPPVIEELSVYTLDLMVGGNDISNMVWCLCVVARHTLQRASGMP